MHRINMGQRPNHKLDGQWSLLPDPMHRGTAQKWWSSTRKEGEFFPSYDDDAFWPTQVPSAFNRLHQELAYYEGQVIYLHHFQAQTAENNQRIMLHFEGVADRCKVFLNGIWVGENDGGFVPFSLDISHAIESKNRLLVYVDNTRSEQTVPTTMHDWWHDGGIHRPVHLYYLPKTYLRDAAVETRIVDKQIEITLRSIIASPQCNKQHNIKWKLVSRQTGQTLTKQSLNATTGRWAQQIVLLDRDTVELWDTKQPNLYDLIIEVDQDTWTDTIGLREIATQNGDILLNGMPAILKGICTWHTDPICGNFSFSEQTSEKIVALLKDLNCNFARAGHQPQTAAFVRACDEVGILLWMEVPAYWHPNVHKPAPTHTAIHMFNAMISQFRNSPSVIIWCIGNECLYNNAQEAQSNIGYFLEAADFLHEHDPSRLVTYTGGFEGSANHDLEIICPEAVVEKLDILSLNSYAGSTDGVHSDKPDTFDEHLEKLIAAQAYHRPVILAEVGIDAVRDLTTLDYGEQRQEAYYEKLASLFADTVQKGFLQGMAPFCLADFHTPIKLGRHQQAYNRKGIVDQNLVPKNAYQILKTCYAYE
ncbi:MAG TPA: hypothetical protein DCM28_21130 [Phycisphaerales bacterium]|nr:hypothetical protein [Phycisphaerales bacterium]HCD31315.1 hypothetical protein [Phycisphaerales bacterium]|tara:strand:- start:74737 stop:76506 length:1770 start_codon:yes stop_codon:yes gene_type:complete